MASRSTKKFSKNGFTLVEVMAAVMVLSIGLVGSLTIINHNLRNISSEENRIIAAALAEDGLERVRNVRDTNWLEGAGDWKQSIEGVNPASMTIKFFCGNSATNDKIPSNPTSLDGCSADRCRIYIYKNNTSGEICYSDNFDAQAGFNNVAPVATNFYRLITLVEMNGGNAVQVNSAVNWKYAGQTYSASAGEILYNWK